MKYFLASLWLLFTLTFAGWWMYFGLMRLSSLEKELPFISEDVSRYHRMMVWEGSAWMLLLLAGGVSLLYLLMREARTAKELKSFFASFSHDIKTSLSSLRLQTESLQEDLADQKLPLLDRLVSDTVRLQLQLQNSLFLASHEDLKFYMETLQFSQIIESIKNQWPQINIESSGDSYFRGDVRAMESILSNLIQNAIVHGKATKLIFKTYTKPKGQVVIEFVDNGRGFSGNPHRLAQIFYRHTAGSGSGVGLFICKKLIQGFGGQIHFHLPIKSGKENHSSPSGFSGELNLEGIK
ncbi:MAG: HAMP domain-containing histidine kinase [Bdellovibrionales bacterium]|nr:HAMP domain-containing histidine kinase [Bdellovibrionales bacterium]